MLNFQLPYRNTLVPSGEQLGYQITLFLTLAIYTAQFQAELPVWSMYKETPYIAYLVIICIFGEFTKRKSAELNNSFGEKIKSIFS